MIMTNHTNKDWFEMLFILSTIYNSQTFKNREFLNEGFNIYNIKKSNFMLKYEYGFSYSWLIKLLAS